MRPNVFVVLALTVSLFATAGKADPTVDVGANTDPEHYAAMSPDATEAALSSVLKERLSVEQRLIQDLDEAKPLQVRIIAAYLLGSMHMEHAAPRLAESIKLHNDLKVRFDHLPKWGEYPAMEALVRLGSAARPSLLYCLGTSDDATVQKLSTEALSLIYGHVVTKAVLQDEINVLPTMKLEPPERDRRASHLQAILLRLGD